MPGLDRTREVKMLWSNIILSELTCNLDRSILCLLTGGRLEWPSSKVKKLHTKSTPQPLSKKTPKGGRKMAQMIFVKTKNKSRGKSERGNTDLANVWGSERHEGRRNKGVYGKGFYIVAGENVTFKAPWSRITNFLKILSDSVSLSNFFLKSSMYTAKYVLYRNHQFICIKVK